MKQTQSPDATASSLNTSETSVRDLRHTATAASNVDARSISVIQLDKPKSVVAALLLTFLFGPIGLLYASIAGGIIMTIVAAITVPLTAFLAALVIWPVCMIWSVIAAIRSKSKLRQAKAHLESGSQA